MSLESNKKPEMDANLEAAYVYENLLTQLNRDDLPRFLARSRHACHRSRLAQMRRHALAVEIALRPQREEGDILVDAIHPA